MEHRGSFFVEASPYDDIWGIGIGVGTLGIENPANWQGTNWLGECINHARDMIITEQVEVENPIREESTALRKRMDWRK